MKGLKMKVSLLGRKNSTDSTSSSKSKESKASAAAAAAAAAADSEADSLDAEVCPSLAFPAHFQASRPAHRSAAAFRLAPRGSSTSIPSIKSSISTRMRHTTSP
ncbi:hypothetical protein NUW54_g14650 [Trametes sanguinea]|uniref:Uncharacterized protein n=1 Tax=Trametes sanguinea TaxID=158606 RepID=A0ACC1MB01_9APHY|nr:hypothetical protein NUW54_g14650 [Trametes sanguinea]